jgi:hypothetical protein
LSSPEGDEDNDDEDTSVPAAWLPKRIYPLSQGIPIAAWVFKVTAILVVLGGLVSALEVAWHDQSLSNAAQGWVILGIVVGTALAASSFAFFGYVLDLLNAVEVNTRERF